MTPKTLEAVEKLRRFFFSSRVDSVGGTPSRPDENTRENVSNLIASVFGFSITLHYTTTTNSKVTLDVVTNPKIRKL